MSDSIRVFVGCAPNHEDAESQAVLEYSIRNHTKREVQIEWMKLTHDSLSIWSGWNTSMWTTPFSGFRWAIPTACGFEGRAIYTDSDVIFMADIGELWDQQFQPGKAVMAKGRGSWRYCVSLWDCAAMRQHVIPLQKLKSDPRSHSIMNKRIAEANITQPFEGNWNCLDGEDYERLDNPDIKAIHYTAIANQPHLPYAMRRLARQGRAHWFNGEPKPHWRRDLVDLFDKMLWEARNEGYPPDKYTSDPIFGDLNKRDLTHYRAGRRV